MIEQVIRLGLLVLCWTVVVVRISALRSPRQRPVWFTLLTLGLGVTMLQSGLSRALNRLTGIPLSSLVSGLLAVSLVTALLAFAVRVWQGTDTGPAPWQRLRMGYALATAVVMSVSFAFTVMHDVPARDRFLPPVGTFNALTVYWLTYLSYMFVVNVWATVLFWRELPRVRSWLVRTAVLLLALATTVIVVYSGTRVAAVFSTTPELIRLGLLLSSTYFVLVALGCSVAAIEPLAQGAVSWWHCTKLYPLWRNLCHAVPHVALQKPRGWFLDVLAVRNGQLRLHRRLIEIRDGLLVLRDWVTPADLERIDAAVTGAGLNGDGAESARTACWLQVAIHAKQVGNPRIATEPLDLARHGGSDADSELRWLRAVAKEWRSPIVLRCAEAINAERPPVPVLGS
ncbi:hypothetical protein GCM10012275_57220 [Longimycelium tulufanense]|uniref:DUF6545 domain-containing protein n=1 Tax=Longimycelium tulufanense TaxID=907463 RepID=A0A8J3CJN2_9PSEU|nr:MAB_1171c family putative transporter [Longimycelium tulufanense]GGM79183.1 hypothetical protein GCM10012275_57220 [Longimycelium tulufanense]